MHLSYEITAYDRQTKRLVDSYEVPDRRVPSIKRIIGIPESDDGLGSYPLTEQQVSEIAIVLETCIGQFDKDFFLEPFAQPNHAIAG